MRAFHLLVLGPDGAFGRLELNADSIEVGRDPRCALRMADPAVSRKHARLRRADGTYAIEDLRSRTGILLNGRCLSGPTLLSNRDWFRVGNSLALFCAGEPHSSDESRLRSLAAGIAEPEPVPDGLEATQLLMTIPIVAEATRQTASVAELALLETVSRTLNSETGLDEVLTVLLGVAFDLLGPERGAVLLRNGHEPLSAAVVHPDGEADFVSRTVIDHALDLRATVVVREVEADVRFRGAASLQAQRTRAAICCPLVKGDEVLGAMYLDTRVEELAATRDKVALLGFVASYAATAVENALLRRERARARRLEDVEDEPLVARSEAMRSFVRELDAHAPKATPIVVVGEKGTGKLLAARHLHVAGPGPRAPFVALDCSELPGRETGRLLFDADQGLWRECAGGTLVLEHVGAMDLLDQNMLLEALLAGDGPRLVATSTAPPDRLVGEKGFSSRLADLLSDAVIELPRLRERGDDILPLAHHFLSRAAGSLGVSAPGMEDNAAATFRGGKYKEGNAAELRDAVERALILSDGRTIAAEHVFIGAMARQHRFEIDLGQAALVRWLLRRRVQGTIALFTTVVLLGLIALCLLWPDGTAGRLANGIVWGLWWPALLFVFVAAGRLWCTWCPLSKLARAVQSVASRGIKPPAWIKGRSAVIMAGLFALIVWAEAVFHMPDRPFATGLFLLALFVVAAGAAVLTRGEVWCRFACPLGNLSACYSVSSTVHVHANPAICTTQCSTHECYKGTNEESGCPVFLHPLFLKDAHFCKLCMSCVRNCPNGSARLWMRPPLQDLWSLAELNPQLALLAGTMFLSAPLLLAEDLFASPWLFSACLSGLLLLALVLPGTLRRLATRDGDPLIGLRVIYALALLSWGPFLAFHLAHVPGLANLFLHQGPDGLVTAGPATLRVLPALQLLAISASGLAAGAALDRIRHRSAFPSPPGWLIIATAVTVYLLLTSFLVVAK